MFKVLLLSLIFPIFGYSQIDTRQFKGLHKKREFRLSVTGCNVPSCNLEIDITGVNIYDFVYLGNVIKCNSNQLTRNDTAVFIDLRFKYFTNDTIKTKKIIIHDRERLTLRIEKNQGFKVKKHDNLFFIVLVNNEICYIKSSYYKGKFTQKRIPLIPGIIKL